MKCKSCGAEIKPNSKICDYCRSQISYEMQREQELLNKQGCPKCGSTNLSFKREKQGEIKGSKGIEAVHWTVGLCKDCGHTWYTAGNEAKVFHESLHPVKLNGKYGFADGNNRIVIDPVYDKVKPFSCNRAKVSINAKYGFIDRSGEIVIPITYDKAQDFYDNKAQVSIHGEAFFIDLTGNRM